ncbi:methyltransferase domain-containing protein [uncultured Serinicoccus sp.]|uniref:methyltransferase domain-containing protein n=1 Tax=uncultured Serinicoccus sp. TaxID=735514 RepID=UPI00261EE8DE|nr:methyltransferase domain-containing protein [uncultured Serinicoccus sp.]
MQCDYFDAGVCRSCTLMGEPYPAQLAGKQSSVATTLASWVSPGAWSAPAPSPESGFRNKAKLVVAGRKGAPTVGILDRAGRGVDLRGCGLYEPGLHTAVLDLAERLPTTGLTPYDVPTRQGELKHVLLTHSPAGELMARFVLRSPGQRRRVVELVDDLRAGVGPAGPRLRVASLNLQPEHKAVLEGEAEEVLTPDRTLPVQVAGLTLHLGTRSFFQTNTGVAAALYRQVAAWVDELGPGRVWDLYCGVGGFALHTSAPGREVVGVERSAEAVRSALRSREDPALRGRAADTTFVAGDATAHARSARPADRPDVLVVNPPRRGVGAELADWVETSGVPHVVYSSCAATSLARDLARMPSYTVRHARLFDMFPQTGHHEVALLLDRHA